MEKWIFTNGCVSNVFSDPALDKYMLFMEVVLSKILGKTVRKRGSIVDCGQGDLGSRPSLATDFLCPLRLVAAPIYTWYHV